MGLVQTSKVSDVPSLSQETGFWFVLHHVPTGPSAGMYSPGYSEHMPMGKFSNNRAHSNYRVSLHATGALPSEQTPSPRSSSLGLRAISACAFCFTRELLHACLCLQIRQLAGWRGSASEPASTCSALALGQPERLSPLLRLLPCLCAPEILPPGASVGSLSNYTPPLPMLAIN